MKVLRRVEVKKYRKKNKCCWQIPCTLIGFQVHFVDYSMHKSLASLCKVTRIVPMINSSVTSTYSCSERWTTLFEGSNAYCVIQCPHSLFTTVQHCIRRRRIEEEEFNSVIIVISVNVLLTLLLTVQFYIIVSIIIIIYLLLLPYYFLNYYYYQ